MTETWQAEKEAWNDGNYSSCTENGLLWRYKWLARSIVCIPNYLCCAAVCVPSGLTTLALSIIPAAGGGVAAALTGGCYGCSESGCADFKATEKCAGTCAATGAACTGVGVLALLGSGCELACLPINMSCPEVPSVLWVETCGQAVSEKLDNASKWLTDHIGDKVPGLSFGKKST
jgi:hypothetical protein